MRRSTKVLAVLVGVLVLVIYVLLMLILPLILRPAHAGEPRNQRLEFYLRNYRGMELVTKPVWVHPRTGTMYPWYVVEIVQVQYARRLTYWTTDGKFGELVVEPDVEVWLVYETATFHRYFLWPFGGYWVPSVGRERIL